MEALPEVVLERICYQLEKKDLIKLAKTCKRLRNVCYEKRFWPCADLERKEVSGGAFGSLFITRSVKVAALHAAHIRTEFCWLPAGAAEELTHLDLTSATFENPRGLTQALSLENVRKVTDDACGAIAQMKSLTTLSMRSAMMITDRGLTDILTECASLVELSLGLPTFSADHHHEPNEIIVNVAPASLQRLSVTGQIGTLHVVLPQRPQALDLKKLCASCPNLVELQLDEIFGVEDGAIESLCALRNLRNLSITHCFNLNPDELTGFKHVDVLNIYGEIDADWLISLKDILPRTDITAVRTMPAHPKKSASDSMTIWGQHFRE